MTRHTLTLAHSPDPDDAFMWWPITGKIDPSLPERLLAPPAIDTGRFAFRAVPADIEVLNRRAAEIGDLDITALSFRNACDVQHRYAVTDCGSSFGEGFGPKLVSPGTQEPGSLTRLLADPKLRIAIPGRRTTAFLVLAQVLLAVEPDGARALIAPEAEKFVELPFDHIIPAIARGQVAAGLVIHEGQILFEQAGLSLVLDLGRWWHEQTGLPLPLGANALRRDLDDRFGAGSKPEIARILRRSIDHALAHRNESLAYTMPFALANATRSGRVSGEPPTIERVDRYVRMYVNSWTVDMGAAGRAAVRRLLSRGHQLGLCPDPAGLEFVGCD